jgi:peptidoglycan/xylan/chitin deacetylase (PgdA/CDA1 family)
MQTTIALMYHAVGTSHAESADAHYTVATRAFGEQIELCQQLAGGIVSARRWLDGAKGVVFTFDDGHLSNFTDAFPTLVAAKATADFFVNPAQVGQPGYASWAQLREMADGGMSIQSHGLDHRNYLTSLSPEVLREQLSRARQEIENHVGHKVTLLAPVGGRAPRGLAKVALEVGYTHVLNSRPGLVRSGRITLPRLAVTAKLDLGTLESWLHHGSALRKSQLRYAILALAKHALGDARYERVRKTLLGS